MTSQGTAWSSLFLLLDECRATHSWLVRVHCQREYRYKQLILIIGTRRSDWQHSFEIGSVFLYRSKWIDVFSLPLCSRRLYWILRWLFFLIIFIDTIKFHGGRFVIFSLSFLPHSALTCNKIASSIIINHYSTGWHKCTHGAFLISNKFFVHSVFRTRQQMVKTTSALSNDQERNNWKHG